MSARAVETTVTYLTMASRPGNFPPIPTGPRLALMKPECIPLHFYRYLYATIGRTCLWVEREGISDRALANKVHADGIEISVLYADGAPAGYYELDFSRPRRTNLVYFGLMPEWTGKKIGPWFLGSAVRDRFSRGADEVTVNTCTLDHPAALPLYQKLGFVPVRQESRVLTVPAHLDLPAHVARGGHIVAPVRPR
jgi:GNAT superfamily N-acetyltransferase